MNTVNDTTSPADPPPYQQPGHRLTRSTDDKVVGGLAGGLGRWFGIDPVVFRIAFVVLTLAGGSGILLYLIGWLMIADDSGSAALNRFGNERNTKLVAAVLAGLGLLILLDDIGGGEDDLPLGVVLVGLGGLYLWSRRKSADGGPPAPPTPPSSPTRGGGDTAPLMVFPPTDRDAEPSPSQAAPPEPVAPVEPKSRSALVPVTLSLLAVLAGGLTLFGVSVTTGLALALLLTGAALVVGTWRGRARWLIPVGLVLSMALAAATVVDVPIRGGAGEISFHPIALEDIRSPYRLGGGILTVDLRDLDLAGQTVTIVASVSAGELVVVLPAGAGVEVDAHVGAGDLVILGRASEGFDIRREVVEGGSEGAGRVVLRAQAGLGRVEVRRAFA